MRWQEVHLTLMSHQSQIWLNWLKINSFFTIKKPYQNKLEGKMTFEGTWMAWTKVCWRGTSYKDTE